MSSEKCVTASSSRQADRFLRKTPYSSRFWTTGKTPRSRRVIASTRTARHRQRQGVIPDYEYEGLLKKTWKTYSLSPLYNFKANQASLVSYARSLDAALTQEKARNISLSNSGSEKSSFSIYHGLSFQTSDPEAIQIQAVQKNSTGRGSNIVLNALLLCVDLDQGPVPSDLAKHFTYYPVIMISGNKTRTDTLLSWLESHFDCRSSPLLFNNNHLRWMLAACSSQIGSEKKNTVLMQYSLGGLYNGISTIDYKFDSVFCHKLWERLYCSTSARESINEDEVNGFVESLEGHMEYTMPITFSKLSLSEVGTPLAYISSEGKLKLLSSPGVHVALHLICAFACDKFMES